MTKKKKFYRTDSGEYTRPFRKVEMGENELVNDALPRSYAIKLFNQWSVL